MSLALLPIRDPIRPPPERGISDAHAQLEESALLQETAQRHQALIENTHEIIYSHDLRGNYTSMNKAGERLTGYSQEEALQLNLDQVIAPEYRETVDRMIKAKLAGEQASFYEIEIITKNGHRLPLEVSTHLILSDGTPVGVQGVARDISARRKREAKLIESEQRYKQLVNEATDIIYRTDLTGHFTFVNPIATQFMRRTREELIGLHYLELIREDYRQSAADFYRRQVKERIPATYLEFPAVAKDGSEIWIGQNVQLLMRNGQPVEMQAVARDITARKKVEEQLLLSEERFSKAFNFMPLAMSLTSFTDMRIIEVNQSFLTLNGYQRDEVIGKTAPELDLWADSEEERQFLERLKTKHSVRDQEIKVPSKDGNVRTYVISAEIINLRGEECVLAVTRDITEHRALEEQLRHAQRMESIGQLAGGVAHDFNNILTAILGYSQISIRRLGIQHPVTQNIEQIQKAGTRAASLTRQLLAFSRRQMLQPELVDLNALVADMKNMAQRLIGEDITLTTILKSELGQIKADPGQIEQVILNLVINARDAMLNGGIITIETDDVKVDQSFSRSHPPMSLGHYVLLAISDNGVGMNAATQKRIFEPFFTTKEVGKGTGLGLSTVYGIVKQSDGFIWVHSQVGQGTTFKLYLPRVEEIEEPEAASTTNQPELTTGHENILIVEDEDQVRDLAKEILEEMGYSVMTAADGAEGVRICQVFPSRFDLVIADVVMPMISGTELAQKVSKLQPQAKILYMSGYTSDSMVRHGVLEHEVFFLQKPFTPTSLTDKVREVLDAC